MTDFGDTSWPKAAKDHRCIWCGESILRGEKHAHYVGKWDGEFQDWRMHSECYEDGNNGHEIQDGFMPYEHTRPRETPENDPIGFGPCRTYQPDHNGECLNCDEPADVHDPAFDT